MTADDRKFLDGLYRHHPDSPGNPTRTHRVGHLPALHLHGNERQLPTDQANAVLVVTQDYADRDMHVLVRSTLTGYQATARHPDSGYVLGRGHDPYDAQGAYEQACEAGWANLDLYDPSDLEAI